MTANPGIAGALDSMGNAAFGTGPSSIAAPKPPDQDPPFPLPVPNPPHTTNLPPPIEPSQPYTVPAANANDSVEGHVAGLIRSDSDLMKLAAQSGATLANRRGLGNSSIAAGASEAEVLKAATPIATADANIAAQKNLGREAQASQMEQLRQQSGYDITKLQTASALDIVRDAAQAKNATDLAKVQGTIQSALQSQGNSEQIQRMGVDLSNQLQLQSSQLTSDLQKIAAAGDQDIRRLVEAANQERVTLQQSIAAQDRDRMATAMVNIFQIEAQMRASLLGNTNIPANERAAYEKSISALGDPIRVYISQLFGTAAAPAPAPTTTVPVTPQITPPTTTPTGPVVPTGDTGGVGTPVGAGDNGTAPNPAAQPSPGLLGNVTPEELRRLGIHL